MPKTSWEMSSIRVEVKDDFVLLTALGRSGGEVASTFLDTTNAEKLKGVLLAAVAEARTFDAPK